MLHNSSYRDREEYNKRILKEAQGQHNVRLAEEWNDANKSRPEKAAGRRRTGLLSPVVRLVEFILITLRI